MKISRKINSTKHYVNFGIILFTIMVIGCDTSNGEEVTVTKKDSQADIKTLEKSIGIIFPQGTTLIRYGSEAESDLLVRAKLIFTPSQWRNFLKSSQLDGDAFIETKRYILGTNFGWWNPQDSKALPTTQISLPGAKVLNVGVDRSNPKEYRVYLVWHGT